MAHILLGWELGGNRGHAVRLAGVARLLRGHGHRISYALQRIDGLGPADAAGDPVWQAPLTPRLLAGGRPSAEGSPTSMGDILARLGMAEPGIVTAMMRAWHGLLDQLRPDVVLGDFAPFLLTAARGRVPTVALGIGFSQPPAGLARFPQLMDLPPSSDQEATLDGVNAGLAAAGCAPLAGLPEVFAADRLALEGFAELDPYAASRALPLARPVPSDLPAAGGGGDEIFVYGPERFDERSPLWNGLAAAGVPVRVHVSRSSAALADKLAGLGFAVEPEPLPFERIVERSRLLVSHGGHGFVSSGLAAGLPQVVCHYDLEKVLNGLAVTRLEVGGHAPLATIKAEAFGNSLAQLYRDEALAARARAAGEGFRSRALPERDSLIVDAVADLT